MSPFEVKLDTLRQQVRDILKTTDDEAFRKLQVPWEWIVWTKVKKYNTLPVAGGVLEQPHILMLCLDIIDEEIEKFKQKQKELEARNRELREKANEKKPAKKS